MTRSRARPARARGGAETAAIAIVGRGRLGTGLSAALRAAGLDAQLTAGRAPAPRVLRAARVWLLAVPDPLVGPLAERLAPLRAGEAGRIALHTSASVPLAALAALAARGASVGVMHPLVSFASKAHPPALAGTTFVLAGARPALAAARQLARALGARPIARSVHGPRYHALAALVANGAAALAGTAQRELEGLGFTPSEARRAVGALLRSVAENVEALGMPAALTGPIARGDAAAVRAQRAALGPTLAGDLYAALGPAILAEAVRGGLDTRAARDVEAALKARSR